MGREYALYLAREGARVVVNDFNEKNAQSVVDEIISKGGSAIVNTSNVLDGVGVVKSALDTWGRVDILINNAGVLRDASFQKMTPEQWKQVLDTHLQGTFAVTHAAWPHMRAAQYGRILMVTSINGLYGAFGQANYSTAKSAVIGLGKTLAKEGAKINIKVNVVAPGAGSPMSATVMPKQLVELWKAEYVAPMVAWMCHEDFPDSGKIFEVGGGYCGEVHWSRTAGVYFDIDKGYSLEDVRARWDQVKDRAGEGDPELTKAIPQLTQILEKAKGGNKAKL